MQMFLELSSLHLQEVVGRYYPCFTGGELKHSLND